MTGRHLYIMGAGGFGREVADVANAINARSGDGEGYTLAGFYDDAASDTNIGRVKTLGLPFLGPLPDLPPEDGACLVIGIGNPQVRRKIVERISDAGWTFPNLVHPTVQTGGAFRMGEGNVICGGVQITTNVTIGSHVHLNLNCTIGHDARLQDSVSVNPGAAISGEVTVKEASLIGVGAIVLEGRTVGRRSVVGAAACAVKDVPDDVIVKGIPAR